MEGVRHGPLWVKSGHVQCTRRCPLSANSRHRHYSIASVATLGRTFARSMFSITEVVKYK